MTSIRDLNAMEMERVSGGVGPVLLFFAGVAVGVGIGLALAAILE